MRATITNTCTVILNLHIILILRCLMNILLISDTPDCFFFSSFFRTHFFLLRCTHICLFVFNCVTWILCYFLTNITTNSTVHTVHLYTLFFILFREASHLPLVIQKLYFFFIPVHLVSFNIQVWNNVPFKRLSWLFFPCSFFCVQSHTYSSVVSSFHFPLSLLLGLVLSVMTQTRSLNNVVSHLCLSVQGQPSPSLCPHIYMEWPPAPSPPAGKVRDCAVLHVQ